MRKMLFLFLILSVFYGCSDDSDDFKGNYLIEYEENKSYTQTFYYGGGNIPFKFNFELYSWEWYTYGDERWGWYKSTCDRLFFFLHDAYGENPDVPSKELVDKLNKLNQEIQNNNQNHRYYLIADFRFTYSAWIYYIPYWTSDNYLLTRCQNRITTPVLKNKWKIVLGKMEEYLFNGKPYDHLVIIDAK